MNNPNHPGVDAGWIQDLWHYGAAMQGNSDSAFDCETIVQRLEASRNAQRLIGKLQQHEGNPVHWDEISPNTHCFRTMEELSRAGRLICAKCMVWGAENGIEPRTGEKYEN